MVYMILPCNALEQSGRARSIRGSSSKLANALEGNPDIGISTSGRPSSGSEVNSSNVSKPQIEKSGTSVQTQKNSSTASVLHSGFDSSSSSPEKNKSLKSSKPSSSASKSGADSDANKRDTNIKNNNKKDQHKSNPTQNKKVSDSSQKENTTKENVPVSENNVADESTSKPSQNDSQSSNGEFSFIKAGNNSWEWIGDGKILLYTGIGCVIVSLLGIIFTFLPRKNAKRAKNNYW